MPFANPEVPSGPLVDELSAELRGAKLPPPAERRAIRKAAKATLSQVAAALGVDIMTVSRWERGLNEPWHRNATAYRRVLDALGDLAQE